MKKVNALLFGAALAVAMAFSACGGNSNTVEPTNADSMGTEIRAAGDEAAATMDGEGCKCAKGECGNPDCKGADSCCCKKKAEGECSKGECQKNCEEPAEGPAGE